MLVSWWELLISQLEAQLGASHLQSHLLSEALPDHPAHTLPAAPLIHSLVNIFL